MACNGSLSIRLVDLDHVMCRPRAATRDPTLSLVDSRQIAVVPVIRIFGSTPAGQRCCLHLHRAFPYFYVPLPPLAIRQLGLGRASSQTCAENRAANTSPSNLSPGADEGVLGALARDYCRRFGIALDQRIDAALAQAGKRVDGMPPGQKHHKSYHLAHLPLSFFLLFSFC